MNRRDFVKAAGFAAAALTAAAPKAQPAGAQALRRLQAEDDRWEADRRGKPGSERRRRQDEAQLRLLICWGEVEDATEAVLDAHEDDDSGDERLPEWLEDVGGVRDTAGWFLDVMEADVAPTVEEAARAERDRRREAVGRGAYHDADHLFMSEAARRENRRRLYAKLAADYEAGKLPRVEDEGLHERLTAD